MSEFGCNQGHIFSSHEIQYTKGLGGRCPYCGGRVTMMDGKTDHQLRGEEEEWDRRYRRDRGRREEE